MKLKLTLTQRVDPQNEFPEAIATTFIEDFEKNRNELPQAVKNLITRVRDEIAKARL